jgi:hypothetical protein
VSGEDPAHGRLKRRLCQRNTLSPAPANYPISSPAAGAFPLPARFRIRFAFGISARFGRSAKYSSALSAERFSATATLTNWFSATPSASETRRPLPVASSTIPTPHYFFAFPSRTSFQASRGKSARILNCRAASARYRRLKIKRRKIDRRFCPSSAASHPAKPQTPAPSAQTPPPALRTDPRMKPRAMNRHQRRHRALPPLPRAIQQQPPRPGPQHLLLPGVWLKPQIFAQTPPVPNVPSTFVPNPSHPSRSAIFASAAPPRQMSVPLLPLPACKIRPVEIGSHSRRCQNQPPENRTKESAVDPRLEVHPNEAPGLRRNEPTSR